MKSFFRKLRWLTHRPDREAELREELQFHLEEEAGQRRQDGSGNPMHNGQRAAIWAIWLF